MYIIKHPFRVVASLLGLFAMNACSREAALPEPFAPQRPAHFPVPVYQATANPYTREGIALGKALFYEPLLSKDGSISCGSCHAQVHAFADHNVPLSKGVGGRLGTRNTPPLQNLIWSRSFMWDGSIRNIEVMPIAPITDHREMDANWDTLFHRLSQTAKYPPMFRAAFGSEHIDDQRILKALAQFMATLVSAGARYDARVQGKAVFNESELAGERLFQAHCNSCHTAPLFTNQEFLNNGLDAISADVGRMLITRKESDRGSFRVPSLRNVALTYPYMHDGRFQTLEQVLAHYTSDKSGKPLADHRVRNLSFTEQERSDLIAFLKTLSDHGFTSNPKHAPAP